MSIASEIIKLQDEYHCETQPIAAKFVDVITDARLPDILKKADEDSIKRKNLIQQIVSKE